MDRRCIINYADGGWYPRGAARLYESLTDRFNGEWISYDSNIAPECPVHQVVPYAFKFWMFQRAKDLGYKNVLWLDASFWAIKSLDDLFTEINDVGYVFQQSRHPLGVWCSDVALQKFHISRESSLKINMHGGGFIGLNFNNGKARVFLNEMIELSKDGMSFQGSWTNENQEVSTDKRVKGHRHDMSVGTMLAKRMNMVAVPEGKYWANFADHCKYPNVCLLSQGM